MKIVAFGCGLCGKEFVDYIGKQKEYEIEFFLDNKKRTQAESKFEGYNIFQPSKELCTGKFIIVTAISVYKEIKAQLEEYGLVENVDFINMNKWLCEIGNQNLPEKRIWFEDFWGDLDYYSNPFVDILRKYYKIVIDSEDPDYIICSVFGKKALDYNGIRIIYTGENAVPDFYLYDYVIGFEYLQYEDRYLRYPYWEIANRNYTEIENDKCTNINMNSFMKRDFCSRVVSNGSGVFREYFFEELNKVKYVASGGKYKNNLNPSKPVDNKREFLKKYKFNLAFENSSSNGYTTEKIFDAWAAGAIPIYWGDPKIVEDFNEDAFVNCHNFNSMNEAIVYILELEQDSERLEAMLRAPIFKNGKPNAKRLDEFFINIFEQKKENAYRRKGFFSCWKADKCNINQLIQNEEWFTYRKK